MAVKFNTNYFISVPRYFFYHMRKDGFILSIFVKVTDKGDEILYEIVSDRDSFQLATHYTLLNSFIKRVKQGDFNNIK